MKIFAICGINIKMIERNFKICSKYVKSYVIMIVYHQYKKFKKYSMIYYVVKIMNSLLVKIVLMIII